MKVNKVNHHLQKVVHTFFFLLSNHFQFNVSSNTESVYYIHCIFLFVYTHTTSCTYINTGKMKIGYCKVITVIQF